MKAVPHYVKSLVMAVPAVLIGLQISAWIGFVLSPSRQERADFRAYYYAGEMLRAGQSHELYTHYDPKSITSAFIHPAYEALIFVPLTFAPMRLAHAIWIALNWAAVYLMYRTLRHELVHLRELFPWLPLAILASYLPLNEALMQGQDSLILALLVCLALAPLRQGKPLQAGLWLGLGAFRFQFLAILVLLLLLWRAWRVVGGFFLSALGMFVVSVAVAGIDAQYAYVRLLRRLADPKAQPVMGMVNLRGLLTGIGFGTPMVVLIASVFVVLLVAYLGRKANWSERLLLGVAAACLLSYHAFLHDLSVLIVPILITCDAALELRKYIYLGALALVLALPTLLAMEGLPLWLNSLGSVAMLTQMALLHRTGESSPLPVGLAAEMRG